MVGLGNPITETPPGPVRLSGQVFVTPTTNPEPTLHQPYLAPASFSFHCDASLSLLTLIPSLDPGVLPYPSMRNLGQLAQSPHGLSIWLREKGDALAVVHKIPHDLPCHLSDPVASLPTPLVTNLVTASGNEWFSTFLMP